MYFSPLGITDFSSWVWWSIETKWASTGSSKRCCLFGTNPDDQGYFEKPSLTSQVSYTWTKKGFRKGRPIESCGLRESLVKYLFREASEAEFQRMCSGLLGNNIKHLAPGATTSTRNSPDILAAFSALDKSDKEAFIPVVRAAIDEEFLIQEREKRARGCDGARASQEHFTPSSLQSLCPQVAGSAIRRHPKMKRYQAFYPYEGVVVEPFF